MSITTHLGTRKREDSNDRLLQFDATIIIVYLHALDFAITSIHRSESYT
jgi:hypothetical protein